MSACNDWSSDLVWSVQSLCSSTGRLAQVINVRSSAYVQEVEQLNGHDVLHARKDIKGRQPGFRALDARASCAVSHVLQSILKFTIS